MKELIKSCTISVKDVSALCGLKYGSMRQVIAGKHKLSPQRIEQLKSISQRVGKIKGDR